MGTRHLTLVQLDNKIKVAQYGQWDGYPTGAGKVIVNFLLSFFEREQMEDFKNAIRECTFISDDELNKLWEEVGAKGEWVDMATSDRFKYRYPNLHRDTGADVLFNIRKVNKGCKLKDSSSFANDSLFCEFAYVVNLDTEQLEIYTGFNKIPLTSSERFSDTDKADLDTGYRSVRLHSIIPFSELDDSTMEDFETFLNKSEEDCDENTIYN